MFIQQDRFSCGTHALLNGLEAKNKSGGVLQLAHYLGLDESVYGMSGQDAIDVVRKYVKGVAGTNRREGTSTWGIYRSIKAFGYKPTRYYTKNGDNAWKWLVKWSSRTPIIICLYRDTHYGTVSGYMDGKVILIDPDPISELGDNGVHMLDKSEMLDKWLGYRGGYWACRIDDKK